MAKVKITGHASGSGVITVTAPNTSTDRTITLPDATDTLIGTATTDALTTRINGAGGRKNFIMNGGFDVWQRGTSATKSGDGYGGYLSADRWATYYDGNTISRQTGTFNGSTKYVARVAGSAGSTNYIYQKIESASSFVSGKTVTQSYWARANVAVTLYSEYRFYNSGGEVNNVQTTLPTVALTTSWQKITDTRVLTDSSTDLTRDLFVLFKADCNNSGDYIEIADVQLELGSTATDFEHRSYGEELALCQRYYQQYGHAVQEQPVGAGVMHSATQSLGHFPFLKEMRAIPSISFSGSGWVRVYRSGSNVVTTASGSIDGITLTSARLNVSGIGSATAGSGAFFQLINNKYVYLDAEL